MSELLAVRHGETPWNDAGRAQGWAPVELSERGRAQARELRERLAAREGTVDHVVASDLPRARETARVLVDGTDLPAPNFERAFREVDVGVLQGLPHERVYALDEATPAFLETPPERGESLRDMAARVRDGLESLRAGVGPGETVLLVTHGGPLRVLLAEALGTPLGEAILTHSPENCSVHAFDLDGDLALAGAPPEA